MHIREAKRLDFPKKLAESAKSHKDLLWIEQQCCADYDEDHRNVKEADHSANVLFS